MNVPTNAYGFVYITTNVLNGKKYLGQKKIDEKGAWKKYLGSGVAFKKAVKKYGKENFSREIIKFAFDKDELNNYEKTYSEKLNCVEDENYYNMVYGGGVVTGLKMSEETIEKLRKLASGKNNYFYGKRFVGKDNPFYGKKHSAEARMKMSKARKGIPSINKGKTGIYTEKTLLKMSLLKKGKPLSEAHREAIRKTNSGKNHPMYGRVHSEKTKSLIREKAVGRIASQTTKSKMSISQLERYKKQPKDNGYLNKRVICTTTGMVFNSIKEACEYHNMKNNGGISRVCKGKGKTSGKSFDGTPLEWEYYDKTIPR